MEPLPGCHPRTPRRPDTLNCCPVHKQLSTHNSQSLPSMHSRGGDPLIHQGELQHSGAQPGIVSIPTPAWRLTPWETLEKEKVQPLSRSLVPEPVLWVEVSPTVSSWYRSTFRTSSGSFPTSEVTFHAPRTSLRCLGSAHTGPRLCLPPGLQCTRPQ